MGSSSGLGQGCLGTGLCCSGTEWAGSGMSRLSHPEVWGESQAREDDLRKRRPWNPKEENPWVRTSRSMAAGPRHPAALGTHFHQWHWVAASEAKMAPDSLYLGVGIREASRWDYWTSC